MIFTKPHYIHGLQPRVIDLNTDFAMNFYSKATEIPSSTPWSKVFSAPSYVLSNFLTSAAKMKVSTHAVF